VRAVVGSSNGTLYDIDTKRDTVYLINQASATHALGLHTQRTHLP
jgi:hypothetical protein